MCQIGYSQIMKRLNFVPLATMRYPELVAKTIQKRILARDVESGDRLPSEQELTAELAVSRPVIREALRLLEARGLVRTKKGRGGGIFVSHHFHEPWRNSLAALIESGRITFDHVFEVRVLTEPSVAALACIRATAADLEDLRSIIEDSRKHTRDAEHLRRNNLDFHVRLAQAAGNPILAMMVQSNLEILENLVLRFLQLSIEQHFVNVHEGILEAVERRDESLAHDHMRKDILEVRERLHEIMAT